MLKVILILLWVFFTLFSLFGGLGLDEIFPVFNTGYASVILLLNFYLSNVVGSFIGGSLGRLNRLLILLGTAILLLVLETYGVYYLFWELFELKSGFWSGIIFLFTLILVLTFGGIRQILILLIESLRIGADNYFNAITKNLMDSKLGSENKNNTFPKKTKSEIKGRKPKKIDLNNDLYNY